MTALPSVRLRDRVSLPAGKTPVIDVTPFAGTWINTEWRAPSLARIEVRTDGGSLLIRPFGPHDWGEAPAEMICATSITATEGGGFVADFTGPAFDAQLQATLNQGLLVVVVFSRFGDGRRRVTREFFRK